MGGSCINLSGGIRENKLENRPFLRREASSQQTQRVLSVAQKSFEAKRMPVRKLLGKEAEEADKGYLS